MTVVEALAAVTCRSVRLTISGGEMRARAPKGAMDDELRQALARHKQAIIETFGDCEFPDATLAGDVHVPASIPNTVEAIAACLDEQRVSAAA